MVTAKDLARLCCAIYDSQTTEFSHIHANDDVYCGVVAIDGLTVIAFRGTADAKDIMDDLEAIEPIQVPLVGNVCDGFWVGVDYMFDELCLKAGDTVILTGHSKGAANAALMARLCLLRGIAVEMLYLFAPPKIGMQDVVDGLRNVGDLKAWCNGIDPVPHLPPNKDFIQFPLNEVFVPPGGLDDLNPVAWHNCNLYLKSVS